MLFEKLSVFVIVKYCELLLLYIEVISEFNTEATQ